MSNESPAAIIYSSDGYEATVKNGVAIVAGTPAIIMAGSDGTNSRYATLDSSGRLTVSGAGTAGAAAGGVVTIQGIAGGTTVPVSGTVTATNASVSTTGAAVPGSATYMGISDGTNLVAPRGTTGTPAGTEFAIITRNIPSGTQTVAGSGNFNVLGTGTAGTAAAGVVTIQGIAGMTAVSISGTVTANIGTTNGLALDTTLTKLTISPGTALGSNTLAMVGGSVTTAAPTYTTGTINNLSLTTAGALRVDGSASTQPVSGTITANAGTGNFTVIGTGTDNTTNSTAKLPVLVGVATTAAPTYTTTNMVPLSLTTSGLLRVDGSGVTQPVSGTITANIGTSGSLALDATLTGGTQTTRITDGTNTATVKAASTAAVAADKALVVAISPNNSITAAPAKSTTGTLSNVTSSAASVTLLASNANRLGGTIYNDSNKRLYVKLGASASSTSFTQILFGQGYYEIPANYSGVVDGVWESANGFARVTELT